MGHCQSASSFPAGSTVKAQLRMAAGAYHWDDVVHKVKGKGVGEVRQSVAEMGRRGAESFEGVGMEWEKTSLNLLVVLFISL